MYVCFLVQAPCFEASALARLVAFLRSRTAVFTADGPTVVTRDLLLRQASTLAWFLSPPPLCFVWVNCIDLVPLAVR